MIKKKKKLLFAFIVLIIAVLLFSVIGVITVYLSSSTQPAYPEIIDTVQPTAGTVTITTGSGDVLTGDLSGDVLVGTGN